MRHWLCRLTISELGDTTNITLAVHADTYNEAHEIAYNHFEDYADHAVTSSNPNCPDVPILIDIEVEPWQEEQ